MTLAVDEGGLNLHVEQKYDGRRWGGTFPSQCVFVRLYFTRVAFGTYRLCVIVFIFMLGTFMLDKLFEHDIVIQSSTFLPRSYSILLEVAFRNFVFSYS